jgi:uncharacterized protein (TIGR02271 family)
MNTRSDSTSTYQDLSSLIGHNVFDAEGNKIGTAGRIYNSDTTGQPAWVTVKTGLFGTKESFVPLNGAEADDKGLRVAVHKDSIKDAPRIDQDGRLSEADMAELYRHYGLTPSGAALNSSQAEDHGVLPAPRTEVGRDAAESAGMNREAAGMNREAAARPAQAAAGRAATAQSGHADAQHQSVLRSEERLSANTESVESGRARLRKYVVTSEQKITVPIRREEVHVTREPLKPGEAGTDAKIGEEEREVILHEERPVVVKEIVAVERVSLDIQTIEENREVTDTVRREEVEIDDGTKHSRSTSAEQLRDAVPGAPRILCRATDTNCGNGPLAAKRSPAGRFCCGRSCRALTFLGRLGQATDRSLPPAPSSARRMAYRRRRGSSHGG